MTAEGIQGRTVGNTRFKEQVEKRESEKCAERQELEPGWVLGAGDLDAELGEHFKKQMINLRNASER